MARRSASEVAAGAVVLAVAAGFLVYAVANTGRAGVGGYTLHAAFDNVGGIAPGADVRVAGLKVGSVTPLAIDPKSYQAVATFTVQDDIKLSSDSSATIATGGLLGGNFISLASGGDREDAREWRHHHHHPVRGEPRGPAGQVHLQRRQPGRRVAEADGSAQGAHVP